MNCCIALFYFNFCVLGIFIVIIWILSFGFDQLCLVPYSYSVSVSVLSRFMVTFIGLILSYIVQLPIEFVYMAFSFLLLKKYYFLVNSESIISGIENNVCFGFIVLDLFGMKRFHF